MAELIISRAAIEHNAAVIRQAVAPARLIGVVKANGYGLGTINFARRLVGCGVRMLAVSDLADALQLRAAGFTEEILLLSPLYAQQQLLQAISNDVTITITSRHGVQAAEQAAEQADRPVYAHLAIETGFGRYGFASSEPDQLVSAASACDRVRLRGVFSHLSDASGRHSEPTEEQYRRFITATTALEEAGFHGLLRHLANSPAALRFDYTRLDAVRIGSAWLGRLSLPGQWGLERVGYLSAPISDIYDRPAGANIGYGNTYRTKRPTRTAVIEAGYYQGFALERSHRSARFVDLLRYVYHHLRDWLQHYHHQVEINGVACPVLGAVGLCSLVVDVSAVDCQIGDRAHLAVNPFFTDSTVPRSIE